MVNKKNARRGAGSSLDLVSVIARTLGLYFIVSGFLFHLTTGPIWNSWWSLLWYLVGFFFFGIAKHTQSCKI